MKLFVVAWGGSVSPWRVPPTPHGASIRTNTGVKRILAEKGRVTGVELVIATPGDLQTSRPQQRATTMNLFP